ncbi:MAG: hypothetical protein A2X49_16145 [Lentisphaerae bacterium GWF2_52_8]|nr:MAG: hypothetical protein A2X49_16145 [Lentisphaerae bacterium GWF2_52_8]
MKILLVNPPVNRLCEVSANYYPLGLGYLSSCLREAGFESLIYNAEFKAKPFPERTAAERMEAHSRFITSLNNDSHEVWLEYLEVLKKEKPDAVGFSCTSATIIPCLKMAKWAKEHGASTIFGGVHPSILPQETLNNDCIDYILTGEAEKTLPAIMRALKKGVRPEGVPGAGWKGESGLVLIPPEEPSRDMDSLPLPDKDHIVDRESQISLFGGILSSRGCPFKCRFCSGRSMHKGIVRYRKLESVLDEMAGINKKFGLSRVQFFDDSFLLNKKRAFEFCDKISESGLSMRWSAFTRCDSVTPEILLRLKAAGCRYLGCGVESGSDRTLSKIAKGYTRADAIAGMRAIRNSGIALSMNIIIGFPFETVEDVKESISLIRELKVPTNVNTFTPYPGSEIFEEMMASGDFTGKIDWGRMSQHSHYNEFHREMDRTTYTSLLEEMLAAAEEARATYQREVDSKLSTTFADWWDASGANPFKFLCALPAKLSYGVARKLKKGLGVR